jgi:tripartite-type tricarboxylate transporter receptor subunit TctC
MKILVQSLMLLFFVTSSALADQFTFGINTGPGVFSASGEILAPVMGKFLHQKTVFERYPGAGGIRGLRYLQEQAPRDGSMVMQVASWGLFQGIPGIDISRLHFVGSISSTQDWCATWYTSGIKTIDDLRGKEVPFAAASVGTAPYIEATLLREVLGLNIKIILGYSTPGDSRLAMLKGEVAGRCGQPVSATDPEWLASHKINLLVLMSDRADPLVPGSVPFTDLIADKSKLKELRPFFLSRKFFTPIATPPEVSPERLVDLRRSFDLAVKDKEFLGRAEKLGVEVNPISGSQVEAEVKSVLAR